VWLRRTKLHDVSVRLAMDVEQVRKAPVVDRPSQRLLDVAVVGPMRRHRFRVCRRRQRIRQFQVSR
jgi:hypothetical protein